MARLAAIGPSGSRSASRRFTMIGAVAYPRVATRTDQTLNPVRPVPPSNRYNKTSD
jgi:hypothetical protein